MNELRVVTSSSEKWDLAEEFNLILVFDKPTPSPNGKVNSTKSNSR